MASACCQACRARFWSPTALHVQDRSAAVQRARELRLLAAGRTR